MNMAQFKKFFSYLNPFTEDSNTDANTRVRMAIGYGLLILGPPTTYFSYMEPGPGREIPLIAGGAVMLFGAINIINGYIANYRQSEKNNST